MKKKYKPMPVDTSQVKLPTEVLELREKLAENNHEVWAEQRLAAGWQWGPVRDDAFKKHPCLVPYDELPESEKDYDRETAMQTLKLIVAMGYRIAKDAGKKT
jgi:ryanodine receptor 2